VYVFVFFKATVEVLQ